MHTRARMHTCMHGHAYVHARGHARTYTRVHTHAHTRTHMHGHTHMHTHMTPETASWSLVPPKIEAQSGTPRVPDPCPCCSEALGSSRTPIPIYLHVSHSATQVLPKCTRGHPVCHQQPADPCSRGIRRRGTGSQAGNHGSTSRGTEGQESGGGHPVSVSAQVSVPPRGPKPSPEPGGSQPGVSGCLTIVMCSSHISQQPGRNAGLRCHFVFCLFVFNFGETH